MPDKNKQYTNIIDDLVGYFNEEDAIKDAYFGILLQKDTDKSQLVLAVTHKGNLESIKKIVHAIKHKHNPDIEISFASPEEQEDVYDFVRNTNFSFYNATKSLPVNQEIMKQWFSKEKYSTLLWDALEENDPVILVRNIDEEKGAFDVQTFLNEGKPFIPVFSASEMLGKCGMKAMPEGMTAIACNWKEVFGDALKERTVILNPGTHFQVRFN
ncbi:MAG: hypothetical protein COB98_06530 [Flavobacteriaceae bacterium]|nr:MAG: hypothetical protein COB98_06530 [Flavobacteriaceae bacterium]